MFSQRADPHVPDPKTSRLCLHVDTTRTDHCHNKSVPPVRGPRGPRTGDVGDLRPWKRAIDAFEYADEREPTGSYALFNAVDPAVAT